MILLHVVLLFSVLLPALSAPNLSQTLARLGEAKARAVTNRAKLRADSARLVNHVRTSSSRSKRQYGPQYATAPAAAAPAPPPSYNYVAEEPTAVHICSVEEDSYSAKSAEEHEDRHMMVDFQKAEDDNNEVVGAPDVEKDDEAHARSSDNENFRSPLEEAMAELSEAEELLQQFEEAARHSGNGHEDMVALARGSSEEKSNGTVIEHASKIESQNTSASGIVQPFQNQSPKIESDHAPAGVIPPFQPFQNQSPKTEFDIAPAQPFQNAGPEPVPAPEPAPAGVMVPFQEASQLEEEMADISETEDLLHRFEADNMRLSSGPGQRPNSKFPELVDIPEEANQQSRDANPHHNRFHSYTSFHTHSHGKFPGEIPQEHVISPGHHSSIIPDFQTHGGPSNINVNVNQNQGSLVQPESHHSGFPPSSSHNSQVINQGVNVSPLHNGFGTGFLARDAGFQHGDQDFKQPNPFSTHAKRIFNNINSQIHEEVDHHVVKPTQGYVDVLHSMVHGDHDHSQDFQKKPDQEPGHPVVKPTQTYVDTIHSLVHGDHDHSQNFQKEPDQNTDDQKVGDMKEESALDLDMRDASPTPHKKHEHNKGPYRYGEEDGDNYDNEDDEDEYSNDENEESSGLYMRVARPTKKLKKILKILENMQHQPYHQYPTYSSQINYYSNRRPYQQYPFYGSQGQHYGSYPYREAGQSEVESTSEDTASIFRETADGGEDQLRQPESEPQDMLSSNFLFNVPARRYSDQYKRSVDKQLDSILGTQRQIVNSLEKGPKNDEDLKFVTAISNKALADIEDRRKKLTKRSLPLTRLIHDPNVKLDIPKTVENFGTATKNAFEDERAPMYHMKNFVGSSKNALLSAMRVPPQNMIIPSDYEIVRSSDLESRTSARNDEDDPIAHTFRRVGEMVRDSIKSGQETATHLGNMAHSARNVFYTAKHSAPRLILPYSQVPALQKTRIKRPNKAILLTPRILDVSEDSVGSARASNPTPNFVRLGHLMDAVGLSRPDAKNLDLEKITLEPRRITEEKIDDRFARLFGRFGQDDVGAALNTLEDAKVSVGAQTLSDFLQKMRGELTGLVRTTPEVPKRKKNKRGKMKEQETEEVGQFIETLFDGNKGPKNVEATALPRNENPNEIVGEGLFLSPELLHPFMGRATQTEIQEFLRGNGEELDKLPNALRKEEKTPKSHYEELSRSHPHNNTDLGYVLGAINPLMFERLYNQTVKINNENVGNPEDLFKAKEEFDENGTVGTSLTMTGPMLKPFMGRVEPSQIQQFLDTYNKNEEPDYEEIYD